MEENKDIRHNKNASLRFVRLRRVTGFLSSDYRMWNDAKQAELKDRVKHSFNR